jgi:hypothetical protein
MFPQQPQQQFRTAGADVKFFYGSGTSASVSSQKTWNKPAGVSHVYMMLIGAGGSPPIGGSGGGSAAVTVWYGAAQHVPNSLIVVAGHATSLLSGVSSTITNSKTPISYNLLTANGGSENGTGGGAMTANNFAASGFFQSVAGQSGSSGGTTASPTTFLSGGSGGSSSVVANYGYEVPTSGGIDGYFQIQPIIVSLGGKANTGGATAGIGGIGCGGGCSGSVAALGGQGLVLIASW